MTKYSREEFRLLLLAMLFFLSILYLGFVPEQSDFTLIIVPYLIAFTSYYFITFRINIDDNIKKLIYLAITLRVALLFSIPNLSDDIYRFIWDGRCLHLGISPFQYLPSEIVGEYSLLNQNLFSQLNSPNYYSIYPPVGQIVGYIATIPVFTSWHVSSFVFKLFVLAAEIGTIIFSIKLLKLLKKSKSNILIYALNPLIIIELVGNIHFETFMIFFLLVSIFYLLKEKYMISGISFAFAICSKLLPLMFVPLFMGYLFKKKAFFRYFASVIITCFLLFSLFLNIEILSNLMDSIGLYVNKFEFNGGFYYLLREIGYLIKGFNLIHIVGPFLSVSTVLLISIQALFFFITEQKEKSLLSFLLAAFCTYLFLATIVHPWYVATPLLLCMFTRFRFPVLWSGLIFFTYSNYSEEVYNENLWIVLLEYLLVFSFLIWELKTSNFSWGSIKTKIYSGG